MTGAEVYLVFGPVTGRDFYGIHTFQIAASNLDTQKTTGLCGSFNGNPADDMIPRGESLNIGNAETFAESWRFVLFIELTVYYTVLVLVQNKSKN